MTDDVFGVLKWTYHDCWEGVASFECLRGYGAALDEKDPPREEGGERAEALGATRRQVEALAELEEFANGTTGEERSVLEAAVAAARKRLAQPSEVKGAGGDEGKEAADPTRVELMVDTDGRRKKPLKKQREAWEKLRARGERLWEDVLEKAVELYNRQRPMRVRIWRSTYGEYGLRRCLPEVKSAEEMKRLIRPYLCRVEPVGEDGSVQVGIRCQATWHMDGFGAVVRDGEVLEVGHPSLVHPLFASRPVVVEHPVFGRLRRISDEDAGPWEGFVRCDPFLDYYWAAPRRAEFVHHDRNAGRVRSAVAWEFAGGEFEVRVYARPGEEPGEAQGRAWEAFRADEMGHVGEIMGAIFQMYQEVCEVRRRNWKDRYVDDVVPILNGPEGMRDLVQMMRIHVHPADAEGRVTIGFQFVCSWDYDGISALWWEGKVREWGVWKDAKPVG